MTVVLRLLLCLLCISLSGCLLTRVYTFKDQFCNYQENFALQIGQDVTLRINNPVLLDSDVIWLIGAEPTYHSQSGKQSSMTYVVEKDLLQPDPQYAIPLKLNFNRQDGDNLLSAAIIDKNLSTVITPGLIEETVAHACSSATNMAQKKVEFDLSKLDRSDIPNRAQVIEALGPPQQTLQRNSLLVYRFRLQGAEADVEKSYARIWFHPAGDEIDRLQFRYLRYELDADFEAGTGSIKIHLK